MKLITFQPKHVLDTIENEGIYRLKKYHKNCNQCGVKPLALENKFGFKPIFCVEMPNHFRELGYKIKLTMPSYPEVLIILDVDDELVKEYDFIAWSEYMVNQGKAKMDWEKDTKLKEYVIPYITKEMIIHSESTDLGLSSDIYDNYVEYINSIQFKRTMRGLGVEGRTYPDLNRIDDNDLDNLVNYLERVNMFPETMDTEETEKFIEFYTTKIYKE